MGGSQTLVSLSLRLKDLGPVTRVKKRSATRVCLTLTVFCVRVSLFVASKPREMAGGVLWLLVEQGRLWGWGWGGG